MHIYIYIYTYIYIYIYIYTHTPNHPPSRILLIRMSRRLTVSGASGVVPGDLKVLGLSSESMRALSNPNIRIGILSRNSMTGLEEV